MAFKVSQEGLATASVTQFDKGDAAALAILAVATVAFIAGVFKFKSWLKSGNYNLIETEKKFMETVKRDSLIKVFSGLKQLSDDTLNKILNIDAKYDSRVSPQNLQADIEFNRSLVDHYKAVVRPVRNAMIQRCSIDDLQNRSQLYNGLVSDKLIRETFRTADLKDKNQAVYGGDLEFVPGSLKEVADKAWKAQTGKTYSDLGWTKTTLPILQDHLIYFYYDLPVIVSQSIVKENAVFRDAFFKKFQCKPSAILGEFGKFLENPFGFDGKFVGYHTIPMIVYITNEAKKYAEDQTPSEGI